MAAVLVTDNGSTSSNSKNAKFKPKYQHEWVIDTFEDDDAETLKKSRSVQGINRGMMYAAFKDNETDIKQDIIISNPTDDNNDEADDIKEANDADLDDEKYCVLVIGITGSGKSAICGLLTGQDVETSDGADSVQKGSSLYTSKYDTNLQFIDTMGTQDSDQQLNDQQILKQALRYLNTNKISKLKVIWCVSGGTETRKGSFMGQAKFINALKINTGDDDGKQEKGKENNDLSAWKSVLIVKKEGTPNDEMKGPKEAANSFDANYDESDNENVWGFKCVDWINKEKDEVLKCLPTQSYEQCGYFTADKAREVIQDKLNKLPLFELNFRHEICTKCGTKGDSRYVDATCHTTKDLLHDKAISLRHIGKLINYHPEQLRDEVFTGYVHTKQLQSVHADELEGYHPGATEVISIWRAAMTGYNVILSKDVYCSHNWEKWKCCGKYVYINFKTKSPPCRYRWKCCGQDQTAIECSNADALKIWTCCNQQQNERGCVEIQKSIKLYKCCNKAENSEGCKQKYDCCNVIGDGCERYYPCCNKLLGEVGCEWKCKNCEFPWGIGPDSGCIEVNN